MFTSPNMHYNVAKTPLMHIIMQCLELCSGLDFALSKYGGIWPSVYTMLLEYVLILNVIWKTAVNIQNCEQSSQMHDKIEM